MRRSGLIPLIGILVLTTGLLSATILVGYTPLLGLDLQGGVEVVLRPSEGQEVSNESLDLSTEIIRRRVDSFGVAEPDVTRQGKNIIVQLPGIDDQERAVELVGQTGKLEFRPVLSSAILSCRETMINTSGLILLSGNIDELEANFDLETVADANAGIEDAIAEYDAAVEQGDSVRMIPQCIGVEPLPLEDISEDDTDSDETTQDEEQAETDSDETIPDATTTSETITGETTVPEATTTTADGEDAGEDNTEDDSEDETPDTTEQNEEEEIEQEPVDPAYIDYIINRGSVVTEPLSAQPEDIVIYVSESPSEPGSFLKQILGPAMVDGSSIRGASAVLQGINTWSVQLRFHSGEDGIDKFNQVARLCLTRDDQCPSQLLSITLDGFVESSPQVEAANFGADDVFITGNFSENEARNLALVLRYGALPLEFEDPVEAGLVRSVSATLGNDSLRAGIIAGIIGIILVAAYMIFYYRIAGAIALASLMISGLLLWTVVSYLSETQGLALTLAGVTGLIVSIGVSLDSNVVYFENLKEDLFNGKTLRSSSAQSFPRAFKTIFWANLATLIGAGILWWLAIGSVRGFAAMLGIASLLDLVATYFFLRPAIRICTHSKLIKQKPRWFIGIEDNVPD